MVLMLSVHPSRLAELATPQPISFDPPIAARAYRDDFGNICTGIIAPPVRLTMATDWKRPCKHGSAYQARGSVLCG